MTKPKSKLLLRLILITLFLIASVRIIFTVRNGLIHRSNAKMVAAMEPRLIREFEALPPDSELVKVFGKFQRLSGSGFQLPGGPTLIDRIEMERVAFFERGQASAKVLLLKWEGPASQIPASQFSLWPNENTLRQPGFSGPFYEGGQVLYRHESQFGLEKGPFFIEVSVPCPSKSAE